jgi:hypothetical protein
MLCARGSASAVLTACANRWRYFLIVVRAFQFNAHAISGELFIAQLSIRHTGESIVELLDEGRQSQCARRKQRGDCARHEPDIRASASEFSRPQFVAYASLLPCASLLGYLFARQL